MQWLSTASSTLELLVAEAVHEGATGTPYVRPARLGRNRQGLARAEARHPEGAVDALSLNGGASALPGTARNEPPKYKPVSEANSAQSSVSDRSPKGRDPYQVSVHESAAQRETPKSTASPGQSPSSSRPQP